MTDKHIINIKDINNNSLNTKNKEDKRSKEDKELDAKIELLKTNGYREIEQYKLLVNKFVDDIENLAIFQKISEDVFTQQIKYLCIDEMLNTIAVPIFEGNTGAMPFISEKDFNAMRKDMFNNLINKYINNQSKKNDPF